VAGADFAGKKKGLIFNGLGDLLTGLQAAVSVECLSISAGGGSLIGYKSGWEDDDDDAVAGCARRGDLNGECAVIEGEEETEERFWNGRDWYC
jgi:hypothetical protein